MKLRGNANLMRKSIPFNAEADSLNAAILGPDVAPGDEEFDLFVKEVVREMTAKAGQKCTAIRRAIVPRQHLDALAAKLRERLAKVSVGDPAVEGVKMGALASKAQQKDVGERVEMLARGNEIVFGRDGSFAPLGTGTAGGAFFSPTLLLCRDAMKNDAVHDIEAFGPVSTLMPYGDFDEALALAARGRGSLVATLVTHDPEDRGKSDPADGGLARAAPRARSRGGGRIDRPRLAVADAQARRPGSRRRRRGARRHPRRQALPAARRGAGLADHAHGRHGRIRARRDAARRRPAIRSASTSRSWRSATRC